MTDGSGYGIWLIALLNASIFIMFAFSVFKPRTPADWRGSGIGFHARAARVPAVIPDLRQTRKAIQQTEKETSHDRSAN